MQIDMMKRLYRIFIVLFLLQCLTVSFQTYLDKQNIP